MIRAIYLFLSLLPLTIQVRAIPLATNQTMDRVVNLKQAPGAANLPVAASVPAASADLASAVQKTLCGSRGMSKCGTGLTCAADPSNIACSLIADCPGLCVKLDGQTCTSGKSSCPTGQTCVDKPGDSCNPGLGGTDCEGVCTFLNGRSALSV